MNAFSGISARHLGNKFLAVVSKDKVKMLFDTVRHLLSIVGFHVYHVTPKIR